MTRPHLIAKLIFAAMGIGFLLDAISSIISVAVTLNLNYPRETIHLKIFFIILKLLFAFAVSLILLFRSDWLLKIVTGPNANQCEKVRSRWIIAGFRMTACLCGLLIIYRRMDLLPYYIHAILTAAPGNQLLQFSTKLSVKIFVEIIKWIIAIYLIFGASHYASWQVRTTTAKQPSRNKGVDKYEQK